MKCDRCNTLKQMNLSQAFFHDTKTVEDILLCNSCGHNIRVKDDTEAV